MSYSKLMLAAVLGALSMQMAEATPTREEAAQLGKTLTPMGAIKAGNKEGTIPEWTGGICTPPPDYKPHYGLVRGGGPYTYPFDEEKPLFKITAADVAKYADKLDEANKELFRRFPQTYYVSVYPTHRPACYPTWVYENNIKNVMRPKIVGGDVPSVTGAHAQTPFPIPKTGVEAMWNFMTSYGNANLLVELSDVFVDASGHRSMVNQAISRMAYHYWDNGIASQPDDLPLSKILAHTLYPPGQVGTIMLLYAYLRMDLKGAPAWSYIPGQRRVRMAPEFSYDGVLPASSGTMLYDEIQGFTGKMDRFDFKLLGRKEMFIPYNNKISRLEVMEINTPNHPDPAAVRWELHRVWVVEATLKPGERHVQKRKIFYIDEDSWRMSIYNGMDQADKIHHAFHYYNMQTYDVPGLNMAGFTGYDFTKRAYTNSRYFGPGAVSTTYGCTNDPTPYSANAFSPEGMGGSGIR